MKDAIEIIVTGILMVGIFGFILWILMQLMIKVNI